MFVNINIHIRQYYVAKSSVATILKNKAAIKGADVAMDVKKEFKQSVAEEEMKIVFIKNSIEIFAN